MKSPALWRGAGGGAGDNEISPVSNSNSSHAPQLTDRSLTLAHLRTIWWSQWRQGYRLPAEKGLIVIDGGRR